MILQCITIHFIFICFCRAKTDKNEMNSNAQKHAYSPLQRSHTLFL
jgi:hypothetical protein